MADMSETRNDHRQMTMPARPVWFVADGEKPVLVLEAAYVALPSQKRDAMQSAIDAMLKLGTGRHEATLMTMDRVGVVWETQTGHSPIEPNGDDVSFIVRLGRKPDANGRISRASLMEPHAVLMPISCNERRRLEGLTPLDDPKADAKPLGRRPLTLECDELRIRDGRATVAIETLARLV